MDHPDVHDVFAVLERTPGVLRSLLGDLPRGWLERHEGEGTFGPRDVLAHLVHGERTDWVPRIKLILEVGEARPFVPFDRRGFGAQADLEVHQLLDELDSLRTSNVAFVRGLDLSSGQLALRGRHPDLGTVTLGQLLATWVVHDLNHTSQVVRVMSARYVDAVGPWRQYLGILKGVAH